MITAKEPFLGLEFDTVVHLGAGYGASLSHLATKVKGKRWHLVEGHYRKFKLLEHAISKQDKNEKFFFHNRVVSGDGGPKTWYTYSFSEFSGLKKAHELKALFPGIREQDETILGTDALPDFITQLEVCASKDNLMVIELPGQVLELIQSIIEAGLKPLFSRMLLTVTSEQLFEQSGTSEEIKQYLEKQGYYLCCEECDDADFPILHFSYDKHKDAELSQLNSKIDQLKEEIDKEKKTTSNLIKEFESKNEELAKDNLRLVTRNSELMQRNEMLADNVRRIELQMDLLRELIQRDE